ncbi:MAG: hypothetical protein A2268_13720 [Candidatus Raymondbacteria bacterium RifOxyA12_full_50_37]|uniref:Polymerase nucleotidyl transferase domain-containing protein n=1 Tax=Candidatus Raymondbacteria bacterium RIFOXYD12_FULL_49_13 TaxID=1817890 RepID=A0A1F7FM59_UNCRA|nr:MAG: hypothetical protein A2248_08125 [Candidatus Raymondbacteria bacterium RIFOXYA2_FULL_49_16]OGJ87205.1 MAG: hypothetical protein A2350_04375 [Candidatus Raymondbacteria bacterium RifOxyB12_full_50_8]OGJ91668.1 MAG: hypothetical protein A2268_13720 [Candidatus Raymondbacteria bacterium RifOxyA12_full_50_37]OGJ95221.1 MAG: hypothetical protein A2453_12135 [Candidatus Raymondbacteria bacterium RIFOXYC2_FULL_50_21]OGK05999.1 MAG: hypothetical protein A2487_14450 [Candidatus Raymondbacteria b
MNNNLAKEKIHEVVKNNIVTSQIILFGSQARGTSGPNSDYDVLVITPLKLTPHEKLPYKTIIRKQLLTMGIFSDILIQHEDEVVAKNELPGHIVRRAMEEGIAI